MAPPATSGVERGVGTKRERWIKERGNQLKKIIKIHTGLNKLRSSAGGILDLGFEIERVPYLWPSGCFKLCPMLYDFS